MPGVNVVEKGTGNGTVTDADGKFTLSVSSADAILQFSFVGFKSQEISAGGRTMLDVTLTTDVSDLKEVVVTGYTSERKQDLVSAVSQVSGKETVAIPQSDIGQALQGRVAGVQVTTSGQPGTQSQVRIRGFGSFGNNSPLYVIDGVPTFDYTNINPYDVESQTVLKDAGAASIYGARAASGVIIITTKHGKYDGKTNVSLDMSTSVSMRGNGVDALNPQQQANKVYEALRNTPGANSSSVNNAYGTDLNNPILPDYINVGVPGKGNVGNVFNGDPRIATALANYNIDPSKGQIIQVVAANKSGTDWYKALTRTAPVSRISLGLSSGSERAHYYANFSYLDQQGVTLNQYLKRWNLRLNSEFKPIKNVRIGENVLLTYKSNPTFRTAGASPIDAAYSMPSIIPIYDVKGNWAGTAAPGFNNPKNPVATVTRLSPQYNQQNASQIFGNLYIEADLFKHVTLRSSFGGEIDQWQSLQLLQQTYENSENSAANMLTEASSHSLNYTFTNTLRYENNFGKSTWKGLLGYEAIKNNMGRMLSGSGLNPFSLDPDYLNLSNTSSVGRQLSSSHFQPYAFTGVFAKVDYSWDDKYYLSSTIRRDGSSVFSPANRYGVFPSISGAWRISAEKFMSNASWLTDLKLRGGYGILGNTNSLLQSNAANQYSLFQGGPVNGYDFDGTNNSTAAGFIPLQPGNLSGKWEQNKTTNIGLDATFLDGSWEVVLEVWQKKTEGLLFNPGFLNTGGVFVSNPYLNVGKMLNRGIDLQIIKRVKINADWNLTADGNISPLYNEITQIASGQSYFEPSGNFRNLQLVRNAIGQPLSSFFGYRQIGYFNSAEEVNTSPAQEGKGLGRFKFQDINHDSNIDVNDRTFIGSPIPKFTYGLNINVRYKNWSLVAFLYGTHGNEIYNFRKYSNSFFQSFSGAGLSTRTLESWTSALGNNAKTPILESASNFSTNLVSNSWYAESGSYARLKNLQINYSLPTAAISKLGLQRINIYVQAVNLFTLTKYSGLDPEIVGVNDQYRGIDSGNYPATRQYGIGLNASF